MEQTPMREIEIFGIPALFTEQDIPSGETPPGLHCYQLISANDGETLLGTVLTVIPVEVPEDGERDVYDDDLMLDTEGQMLTPGGIFGKVPLPGERPRSGGTVWKRRLILSPFWRELWRKIPTTINRILSMTSAVCKRPCWKSARKTARSCG